MIHFIYIISSSGRLVWRIFWCAAVTYKLSVYQYLSLLMKWFTFNRVKKTKTIQVFFWKDCSLRPLSLHSPSTIIRTITKKDHRSYSSEYQKGCVVVSFEVNRRCSVLFHSLIDCWTHFNNLRLLLVARSIFFLSLQHHQFYTRQNKKESRHCTIKYFLSAQVLKSQNLFFGPNY